MELRATSKEAHTHLTQSVCCLHELLLFCSLFPIKKFVSFYSTPVH
uniref:Uncharacterized protein n=1 Tax=Arundo donax TaxID=35708 RepID=A0A0A9BRI1_ARUDO